jgi:uncharacterized protein YegL
MNTGIHVGASKESVEELGEQIIRILQVEGVQEETIRHAISCLTASMTVGSSAITGCKIAMGEE